MEGVYQRSGDPGRADLLLQEFTSDARNVKLREKEHQLDDVTDTLKSFLSQTEDALLTKELYPYWVSALGTLVQSVDHHQWVVAEYNQNIHNTVQLLNENENVNIFFLYI